MREREENHRELANGDIKFLTRVPIHAAAYRQRVRARRTWTVNYQRVTISERILRGHRQHNRVCVFSCQNDYHSKCLPHVLHADNNEYYLPRVISVRATGNKRPDFI